MLKRVKIRNFKSFKNFEINLGNINCIIAPNNAGKSNLIKAFEFLYYALMSPEKAIEEFGGFENIRNIFLNKESITFEFEYKKDFFSIYNAMQKHLASFSNLNCSYKLVLYKDNSWKIEHIFEGKCFFKECEVKELEKLKIKKRYAFSADIILFSNKESKCVNISSTNKKIARFLKENIEYLENLANNKYFYTYNFYPEKIKSTYRGGSKLRKDGTNLVEVLTYINENKKELFKTIASSLVGIVEELEDIKIDKDLIERNILLLKEKNKFLPFNITSDGTINLLALITALYEPFAKEMISIDEIEKHLHLKAVDYILDIIKNANYQFCFTTQSGEVMNEMSKNEIIFLYRDYEGFTKSIRADEIANFDKKLKRFKDISTIIKYDILGYLGDYDEKE